MTQNGGPAFAGSAPAVIRVSVMMPMVFCASLVPWASATIDAETIWPSLKPFVTVPLRAARGDPVGEVGRDQRDEPGDDRRQYRGQQHLADQARELHRVGARGHPGGADQAADQRVRGAGGQPHQPGQQVPHDRRRPARRRSPSG